MLTNEHLREYFSRAAEIAAPYVFTVPVYMDAYAFNDGDLVLHVKVASSISFDIYSFYTEEDAENALKAMESCLKALSL